MIITKEGGFQCMARDKEIFQCGCCGNIHKVDEKYKPKKNQIYVALWCEKCKKYTWQLHCGDSIDEFYALYNANLDERMY